MREAVTILLNFSKTHPEEFTASGKFHWVAPFLRHDCGLSLTNEEQKALRAAISDALYREFHNQVMKTTLGVK